MAGAAEPRKTFLLIQVLRGVAALMVVWHHTTSMQNERLGHARHPWLAGAAGVDVFFVISGLVMALSTLSLWDKGLTGARGFLARRLERVAPLYWLATTLKLGLVFAFPQLAPRALNGAWHIVASYLFLPSRNALGALHPVLIVGWTLNYEMFFYLVLALGLATRVPIIPYLSVVLMVLGTTGALRTGGPTVLTAIDPLLFEFLFGVLIATAVPVLKAKRPWQQAVWGAVAFAGFTAIVTHPLEAVRADRALVWGVSSLAIVAAAVALEDGWGRRMPGWMLAVGDASYSNYLTHTLVLAAIGLLLMRYPALGEAGWNVEAIVCVVVCTLAAEVVYRAVERPMIGFFRDRRGGSRMPVR